jgi:hypothetical protein
MRIDLVLTGGNINSHYTPLFKLIHKIWKSRFNLDCYLILISKYIPDYLLELKEYIILWDPIEGINDIYMAQVIRILYPCLFKNKNILITDLDIFPVSKNYFLDSIKDYSNDCFISYTDRYFNNKMLAICYNVANSTVWSKIFNIKNKTDINNFLINKYNKDYDGRKNCPGWYTDQTELYKHIKNWNECEDKFILLNDKKLNFKRLNNRQVNKEKIVKDFDNILNNLNYYTDIHAIKPYSKVGWYLKKITEKLVIQKNTKK